MAHIELLNLEAGYPTAAEAKKRLATELQVARRKGTRVLKVVHGYGSSGKGGKLRTALRTALNRHRSDGDVRRVIAGEDWSIFDAGTRELLDLYPELRNDRDLEAGNAGITIVQIR
jgi:hypothetical protein